MAFFGERVPWTATRNKMDGVDKENGWRQVIRWDATRHFWGKVFETSHFELVF